jgi:NAD(P)-dependent dehydrogenase (short-subunit alcohol dehydrogenase family)
VRLDQRATIVTGAGSGIGRALALGCVAKGARVAAFDLDPEALAGLEAELGEGHLTAVVDVADEAALSEAIAAATEALGPIDACFSNAGTALGGGLEETSRADLRRSLDVNLGAHLTVAQALVPGWLERGEGHLVITASAAGLLTQVGNLPYSVGKHAAVALAEWLSVTYGDRGVGVSCLCPMGVDTAMLRGGKDWSLGDLGTRVVRGAGQVLTPDQVATAAIAGLEADAFLILPHEEVGTFYARKAADPDRWLTSMRRLRVGAEANS